MKSVPGTTPVGRRDSGPAQPSVRSGAQSVDRAADILLSFTLSEPTLSLGDIAQRTGLPKPTTYRLISSLMSRGLMQRSADGRYELGLRVFELGEIAQTRLTIQSVAGEAMSLLAHETGETVLLAQADWSTLEIVVVDFRSGQHALGVRAPTGRRPLLPPGPLGKALLAGLRPEDLPQVLDTYARRGAEERLLVETGQIQRAAQATRQRGYAVDQQEILVGVTGVASWFLYGSHRLVASLAVLAPSDRLTGARIERIGTRVHELASGLSMARFRDRAPPIAR